MKEMIRDSFGHMRRVTLENFAYLVEGVMRSGRCSVWHAARAMSNVNRQIFKTNEKRGNRLIQDENFKVDDKDFESYIKLIFKLLTSSNLLKLGDNIQINVDYTSNTNKFLILMAGIHFGNRAVPLYFSMNEYPKEKGEVNLKEIESAFINDLSRLLPKGYKYTIVADRGFGNARFAQLCEDNGLDFVVRIKEDLRIKIGDQIKKLEEYKGKNTAFEAEIIAWQKRYRIEIRTENESTWFLAMPITMSDGVSKYEKRFAIEKCFQDQKSSGFEIEKCKLIKLDRFKRLYFVVCMTQLLMVASGEYVENNDPVLKKNYIQTNTRH